MRIKNLNQLSLLFNACTKVTSALKVTKFYNNNTILLILRKLGVYKVVCTQFSFMADKSMEHGENSGVLL